MVELSNIETKLLKVNYKRQSCIALYLYGDLAYYTVYNIIKPYKNYLNCPRIAAHNWFNKPISKLCIEVKWNVMMSYD